jgi:site-specific DNA recombinase
VAIAVYLRISHDPTGAQIGVTRQRADCLTIAQSRWPDAPVVEYVDNDISAYSGARRPAYEAMLHSGATAIISYNLDRLLRQPRQLEALIDLGVPIVTAQGDLDLTTHDGQLQARILVAVAKKSSDDTSRRVKRAARDRAEQGRFHGGRIPFPMTRGAAGVLVVDPVHAETVREVARRVVEGETLTSVVRDVLAIEPRIYGQPRHATGAPNTREGWRDLLCGPTIRGYNKQWQPAPWPAVLDGEIAARVKLALAPRSRTRPNRRWPLSAVARCGKCEGKMYGASVRGGDVYSCRTVGCAGVSIAAGKLEAHVRIALDTAVITKVAPVRPTIGEDTSARLEHLASEYALGNITRTEWEAARRVIPKVTRVDHPVRAVGVDLPLERCAEIIDHITVNPVHWTHVDRISILWRH